MRASAFVAELRDNIRQLSIDGDKTIDANNFAEYLDRKIVELDAAEANETDVTVDFRKEHYRHHLGNAAMLLQSALDFARLALNAAMLVNAGAAIAVMTLVGHLSSAQAPGVVASRLAWPLLLFNGGVLMAALAYGSAYLTQYHYAQNPDENDKVGGRYRALTMAVVILSYLLFLSGGIMTYLRLASPDL